MKSAPHMPRKEKKFSDKAPKRLWPSWVPSDMDVDTASFTELAGRRAMLLDLYGEFQGEAGAYAFFAVLLPALSMASIYFNWDEGYPATTVIIALAMFVGLGAVSLHSLVWFLWVRRRLRRVEKLMNTPEAD